MVMIPLILSPKQAVVDSNTLNVSMDLLVPEVGLTLRLESVCRYRRII